MLQTKEVEMVNFNEVQDKDKCRNEERDANRQLNKEEGELSEESSVYNQATDEEDNGKPLSHILETTTFVNSSLTPEEEAFLDSLLGENTRTTTTVPVHDNVGAGVGAGPTSGMEGRPASPTRRVEEGARSNTSEVTKKIKEVYDYPWVRKRARSSAPPAGPPCPPRAGEAEGRPGPTQGPTQPKW